MLESESFLEPERMLDVAFWLRSAENERNAAILEDFATCDYC